MSAPDWKADFEMHKKRNNVADILMVQKLEESIPYDENREYPGLVKQKISRKDKHLKTLDDLSKFLEKISDDLDQDLLSLSRDVRDRLEEIDAQILKTLSILNEDTGLLVKVEADLKDSLSQLKKDLNIRAETIKKYSNDLINLEKRRSDIVGAELNNVVEKLFTIAYKLRHEIQVIIDDETADINSIVSLNMKDHESKVKILLEKQKVVAGKTVEDWEVIRGKWRELRHRKALGEFSTEIRSNKYVDPDDRKRFLEAVRLGQMERQQLRVALLGKLGQLDAKTITSQKVVDVRNSFEDVSDLEVSAIQHCYNGLCDLRVEWRSMSEHRVENLRKELHVYAALHPEPPFSGVVDVFKLALSNPNLEELWRLGGGLKPEVISLVNELSSTDNLVYDNYVSIAKGRLELITCGFGLKEILEKRGRTSTLAKVRSLIVKMRTTPRTESVRVVESLLPDLEEIADVDNISFLFRRTVLQCVDEMKSELLRVQQELEIAASAPRQRSASTATMRKSSVSAGTGGMAGGSVISNANSMTGSPTGRRRSSVTHSASLHGTTTDLATGGAYIDPSMLKMWNRSLGIIYFACDLPAEVQQACIDGGAYADQQRWCNELVDAVVKNETEKPLFRLEKNYHKLIESITAFLESQANLFKVTATNVCGFFKLLALSMEHHRKTQKQICDDSEILMFDVKEDFRLECEDREALFKELCQTLRQSIDKTELQSNFQTVLECLVSVEDSYRKYHAKACYCADSFNLITIGEFRKKIEEIASVFRIVPDVTHPLLLAHDNVYEETVTLNRNFLDENPEVSLPMKPREAITDPASKSSSRPTSRKSSTPSKSTSDLPPPPDPMVYVSPNKATASASQASYAGTYNLLIEFNLMLQNFLVDGTYPVDSEEETEDPLAKPEVLEKFDHLVIEESRPVVMSDLPFILAKSSVLPMAPSDEAKLDAEDREEYLDRLAEMFVEITAEAASALDEEKRSLYNRCLELVSARKADVAMRKELSYILANPPVDILSGNCWVSSLQIGVDDVGTLLKGIRDSLVCELESDSFSKLTAAKALTVQRKAGLTDELEDRLRTHWPRRGRVETQVKQPREAELRSHQEKTYRHLQTVIGRMDTLQDRFLRDVQASKSGCGVFVESMKSLQEYIANTPFKNLAALQGVDIRARSAMLKFQTDCANVNVALSNMSDREVDSVIAFAHSFIKLCPPQMPGEDGGYSSSELDEINRLVDAQCVDIEEIRLEWRVAAVELEKVQKECLSSHADFCSRYEKVARDLAMSEGLGQIYGAPRRRAQERIRTAVTRDEQAAGKVDEMLAKLDFAVAEMKRRDIEAVGGDTLKAILYGDQEGQEEQKVNTKQMNASVSVYDSQSRPHNGRAELEYATELWEITSTLRQALVERVAYLDVAAGSGKPVSCPKLAWISLDIIPRGGVDESPGEQKNAGTAGVPNFSSSGSSIATLSALFRDVEESCRKETRELYEKEGALSMLGDGVPASLEAWFAESKDKLLGSGGYRERAWKRLWEQADRLELMIGRKGHFNSSSSSGGEDGDRQDIDMESPEIDESGLLGGQAVNGNNVHRSIGLTVGVMTYRIAIPSVCIKTLTQAFLSHVKSDISAYEAQFVLLVKVWEMGRDKHERELRPCLGAPEGAAELARLDALESERSKEMLDNVYRCRNALMDKYIAHSKNFVQVLGHMSSSLLQCVDTCLRQESMMPPPGMSLPKKRMTEKRLRKAQRLRQEVNNCGATQQQPTGTASNNNNSTAERSWPAVPVGKFIDAFTLASAVQSVPIPVAADHFDAEEAKLVEPVATAGGSKGGKATKGKLSAAPAAAPSGSSSGNSKTAPQSSTIAGTAGSPSVTADHSGWVADIAKSTAVKSGVSSAHRAVVVARDAVAGEFAGFIARAIEDVRVRYARLMSEESTWRDRWRRQVALLRRGNDEAMEEM